MGPKPFSPCTEALLINRLDELLNLKHPLMRLAGLINWAETERTFSVFLTSGRDRPALPPRLVAGRLQLQHNFDASDEAVVIENPYCSISAARSTCRPKRPSTPPA